MTTRLPPEKRSRLWLVWAGSRERLPGADVSIEVTPKIIEPNERIVIDWPGYSGPTTVEWNLASQNDGTTYVRISETGFVGDADDLMNYVVDSTQGFTWMLAGLKALLEHGVRLNLTADAHPKGVVEVR